jgi:hypothetical protein
MIIDQITDAIPMIKIMKRQGSVFLDGGDDIIENLMHTHNNTFKSYSGWDPMDLTPQDTVTAAKFNWKDHAGSIVYTKDDIRRNRAKWQMKNLANARTKQLRLSAQSIINSQMYLDGTGNDSKDLTGLANLVADTATNTCGTINRTNETWWRNVSWTYDTAGAAYGARQGGTANTTSIRWFMGNAGAADNADTTFLYALDYTMDEVTFGDTGPHFGVCNFDVYQRLKHALYDNKRFTMADTGRADPGFRHVDFNGIPIVMDRAMPSTTNGTSTAIGRMYFLNLDFMHWYIDALDNFRTTEIYDLLPQQAGYSMLIFLRSEFTLNKSNAQAVLHSIFA